jgi:hypothetical protein
MAKNYQAIEQLEGDRAYDKQIEGRDPGRVIEQEGLPALRWWSAAPDHISADGRFRDLYPKHQQFAMDTRCAPQWISRFMRRISARTSESIRGRPPTWRDFQRQ